MHEGIPRLLYWIDPRTHTSYWSDGLYHLDTIYPRLSDP